MRVPGLFPAAYHVACSPPIVTQRDRLVRAVYAGSDVPPLSRKEAQERTQRALRHKEFGGRYNTALLRDPRYPYHDLCRLASWERNRGSKITPPAPANYGFRNLPLTNRPVDLGEAARRGTKSALDAAITKGKLRLNDPDLFEMTPLAWAIAYGREDEARSLLRAGARPEGARPNSVTQTSPIQIARAKRMRNLIQQMIPLLTGEVASSLHDPPQQLFDTSKRRLNAKLKAVHDQFASRRPRARRYEALITVDAAGDMHGCRMEPSTGIGQMDRRLCDVILNNSRWTPARDLFGEPVPGEGKVSLVWAHS